MTLHAVLALLAQSSAVQTSADGLTEAYVMETFQREHFEAAGICPAGRLRAYRRRLNHGAMFIFTFRGPAAPPSGDVPAQTLFPGLRYYRTNFDTGRLFTVASRAMVHGRAGVDRALALACRVERMSDLRLFRVLIDTVDDRRSRAREGRRTSINYRWMLARSRRLDERFRRRELRRMPFRDELETAVQARWSELNRGNLRFSSLSDVRCQRPAPILRCRIGVHGTAPDGADDYRLYDMAFTRRRDNVLEIHGDPVAVAAASPE